MSLFLIRTKFFSSVHRKMFGYLLFNTSGMNHTIWYRSMYKLNSTWELPKYNKKAVTEISHVHGYAYRCQNTTLSFSLWNVVFWHPWLVRDQIDVEMPKYIFGHVLVTDARIQHFKGTKLNVVFWHLYAYPCTWLISVTSFLLYFGNPRVLYNLYI